MNRRKFLGLLGGGVAAASAARSWPFRVFSFPEEIKLATPAEVKMYDLAQHRMTNRWDVLYGFATLLPFDGDGAIRIENIDADPVEIALRSFEIPNGPEQRISLGPERPAAYWQVSGLQKRHFSNGVVRLLS